MYSGAREERAVVPNGRFLSIALSVISALRADVRTYGESAVLVPVVKRKSDAR
jgi:hypothetical protein